jgi:hypothetical protein
VRIGGTDTSAVTIQPVKNNSLAGEESQHISLEGIGRGSVMGVRPDWLPALILVQDYGGRWDKYVEVLYEFFEEDFVRNRPTFEGKLLGLKRQPHIEGKDATFWHLISEGKSEENRNPDLRRCERIRWPKAIIANSNEDCVKVWRNTRKRETRVCLWLENQEYIVILAKRRGYYLLWTAYPVTREHRKRKLRKEYEEYAKS